MMTVIFQNAGSVIYAQARHRDIVHHVECLLVVSIGLPVANEQHPKHNALQLTVTNRPISMCVLLLHGMVAYKLLLATHF